MIEAAQQFALDKTLNTPTGKKIVGAISEYSSDIPVKLLSGLEAAGTSKTYDEIYNSYKAAGQNPESPTWKRFLYQLQSSGAQSLLGVALSFIPYAGRPISGAYWAALSADEQIKNKGKVDSLGNIAIDTIGDSILGNSIEGLFKKPAQTLIKDMGKNFIVEGGTEVLQTFLKNANDYRNAKTSEEKAQIVQNTKDYITSGAIAMEFGVGGVAGAGIAGGAHILNNNTSIGNYINKGVGQPIENVIIAEDKKKEVTDFAENRLKELNDKATGYSSTDEAGTKIFVEPQVLSNAEMNERKFLKQNINDPIKIISKYELINNSPDAPAIQQAQNQPLIDEAINAAQMSLGETPDIVQQAIEEAQNSPDIIPGEEETTDNGPESIYHQTDQDTEKIKDKGFQMGKNSVFGEAAFFGEKADKTYGENQISVSPKDFNLKRFDTVKEEQDFVESQGAKNLSEAIRKEGKYDGFIIPNKEGGNVYGITDKTKLDSKLKAQQYVTTDEARKMSKNFKFIEELGLPVVAVEKMLTPSGQEAFGKYYKGTISFIENPHKTTIPHEATHAFVDLMLTDKQKQNVLDEVKRRYPGKKLDNRGAEEQLAQDFEKYYIAKFENKDAKAPSSKLKQFFDWFIENLKKLVGKGDIIDGLYKDIISKKPGIIQKAQIRNRMLKDGYNINDLQQEYFQNPDKLTSKFLQNVDIKNREFASYQFLKDLAKSKSLPLKENERALINDILDTQFNGLKKISMDDFRDAMRSELMPLQVIESGAYSDYGSSAVGLNDLYHATHIYNSPFQHGYSGHFKNEMGDSGLFGHTRIWDDNESPIRYVAEIQSDAFQNLERITDRSEKFFENYKNFDEAKAAFNKGDAVFIISKDDDSDYQAEELDEIKAAFDSGWSVGFEKTKPNTKEEDKFLLYKNVWYERIIREEIRKAAMNNIQVLRFPTPFTISTIEGYLGGQIPKDTEVGESFKYGDEYYVLMTKDFGVTGEAVPETAIIERKIYDPAKDSGDNVVVREDGIALILDPNVASETFTFGDNATKENFNYEKDLNARQHRTVARFYDKQIAGYLKKLRRTNLHLITDENGYDWLETAILPEDKEAVEAFQTKPADDPRFYTGEEVADHYKEVEADKDEEADDHTANIIKQQDYELKEVLIEDLYNTDQDLANYIDNSEENRYEEGEGSDVNLPIIVGFWDPTNRKDYGVIDGYNRVLTKRANGDKYIEAFVAKPFSFQPADNSLTFNDPARVTALEKRREQINNDRDLQEAIKEYDIIAARQADLSFADPEQEAGYQNFKKLANRRPWVAESATDDMLLKEKLTAISVDDYLFAGAGEKTNDELLEEFKDRFYQEQEYAQVAKLKTPSEEGKITKRQIERVVKRETVGRKPSIKNAINVALGEEAPTKITMKETTLLKKKIRDMAKGVKIGRASMRETLVEAFRSNKIAFGTQLRNVAAIKQSEAVRKEQLKNLKSGIKMRVKFEDKISDINQSIITAAEIKKAIINYAEDLPASEKGKMVQMITKAETQKDLVKATMRIDAALQRVDKNEQLQELRKTADEIKAAVRTGKSIAVDYQKRLIDILSGYDLKSPTAKTIARLRSFKDYLDANPGFVPEYATKELERLSKKSVGQMTGTDIKTLNDTLAHLMALGNLKQDLRNNYDERIRQASLAKLLVATTSLDPKGDVSDKSYAVRESKKKMYINTLHSYRVTDMLDGYNDYKGPNTRLQRGVSHKVNNAELTATATLKDVFDKIKAIQNSWSEKEQATMEFHLLIQQGAHTQANELATKQGWTEIPKLTENMEIAMDLMRGAFKKTEDYLAAVYEEINNKPFEKVDNYWPLKYERNKKEIPEPTIGQKVMRSAQTEQGFTLKRLPNVKRTPRIDVFAQFEEAIREQQYFMQVQPALLEVRSLVNDEAYKAQAGQLATNWWRDYIDAMSNKGQLSGVRSNAWLRKKRVQLSRAVLGFKLSSIIMQPMAIFDALSYVQMRYGQVAAARLLTHFAATWINPMYARKVLAKSASLQLRQGNAGELSVEEIQGASKGKKVATAINALAMSPLQWADMKTAASVNQAIYKTLIKSGATESDARGEADLIMNIVSGSSEIADRPMVLMSGEGARTIFTFQTFMLNRWGLIAHDFIRSGLVHGKLGRKFKALYGLFILGLAGGLEDLLRRKLYEAISGEKVKNEFNFFKSAFFSIPEAIPVIGQIIQGLNQTGQSFSVPLARVGEQLVTGFNQIQSKDPSAQRKGWIKIGEAVATYNGVPGSAQASDFIEAGATGKPKREPSPYDVELPELPELDLPELPELPPLPNL